MLAMPLLHARHVPKGRAMCFFGSALLGVSAFMFSRVPTRLLAFAGVILLLAGGVALWLSADHGEAVAATRVPAPQPIAAEAEPALAPELPAPDPKRKKNKEEQRFARADRDDDGRITQTEYLHQRRRNFDKLDRNGDGKLSFEEYATSGIAKFRKADANGDGILLAAEFATTAPKPRAIQSASAANCRCPAVAEAGAAED